MHSCAIILLLTFLSFWGGHSASINITDSFLAVTFFLASSLFSISSFIYLVQKKTRTFEFAWTTILLLLFLGWLVYGYRYGLDGEQSMSMAVKYLSGMTLATSFSIYAKESKLLNTVLWTLLVIGGLYGTLCLVLVFNNEMWSTFVDDGIATLFSNLNFLGNFLLAPIAIWPYFAAESKHPLVKTGALATGFLSIIGLYLSSSRGAQLIGIVILGITFLYLQKNRLRGLLSLAALVFLVLTASYFVPPSAQNFLKLGQPLIITKVEGEDFSKDAMGASLSHRFEYWEKSWNFIQENPWRGSGPYSFIVLYKPYQSEFSHNAHNLLLQTTVDSGYIGLALLLLCLGVLTLKLWRELSRGDPQNKPRLIVLGLILLGTQTHYLIEYFWHIPFFLTLFVLLVTMPGTGAINIRSRNTFLVVNAFLFISLIGMGGVLANNLYHYQKIIHRILPQADPETDLAPLLESAKSDCPRCQQPYLELSEYYLHKHRKFPQNTQWIAKSTEELIKAKEVNYRNDKYYQAWGNLLMEQNKTTEALGAYLKGSKLNSHNREIMEKIEQLKSGIPKQLK